MKTFDLISSEEYNHASRKIRSFEERLEKASPEEAMRILNEKQTFFIKMRKSSTDLYAAFEIDDKTIGERIYKKLTGIEIILD